MIESLAETVKEKIGFGFTRSLPLITCAASLAHHRLLGSVRELVLMDVDLTSVPAEHLTSLTSSVMEHVGIAINIDKVSICDLVTILDSVKSEEMSIIRQSLGSEETQALVQAMESHVEQVWLGWGVTLDIRVLMKYNGQGKCWKVLCDRDTTRKYEEQLRTWAKSRNWKVDCEDDRIVRMVLERTL